MEQSKYLLEKIVIMAKAKQSSTTSGALQKTRKKRPGVHSKCKASKLKGSKNYLKKYNGQGN